MTRLPAALRAAGADEFGPAAVLAAALAQAGSVAVAARLLGCPPKRLRRWLARWAVGAPKARPGPAGEPRRGAA